MSTPSTATATNPPPHLHYAYPHHQTFQSGGGGYPSNNSLLSGARLANSHYSFSSHNPSTASAPRRTAASTSQVSHDAAMRASQSSSAIRESRQRQRTPNWREFYKNGLPKEVIVIDDDDDDESPPLRRHTSAYDNVPPTAHPSHSNNTRPIAAIGSHRHADKKRKTAALSTAYDPVYHRQASASNTHTPHYAESPVTTVSTDRTTSALTTTAATSLGSHYSQNGVEDGRYDEVEVVGQKRKRTRKVAADEAKQREIETQGDAYSSYCPPPKPPIKAKEVYVAVAHDVSHIRAFANDHVTDVMTEFVHEASES